MCFFICIKSLLCIFSQYESKRSKSGRRAWRRWSVGAPRSRPWRWTSTCSSKSRLSRGKSSPLASKSKYRQDLMFIPSQRTSHLFYLFFFCELNFPSSSAGLDARGTPVEKARSGLPRAEAPPLCFPRRGPSRREPKGGGEVCGEAAQQSAGHRCRQAGRAPEEHRAEVSSHACPSASNCRNGRRDQELENGFCHWANHSHPFAKLQSREEEGAAGVKLWHKALAEVRSSAQLSLCIGQLQKSINWERSISKLVSGSSNAFLQSQIANVGSSFQAHFNYRTRNVFHFVLGTKSFASRLLFSLVLQLSRSILDEIVCINCLRSDKSYCDVSYFYSVAFCFSALSLL